MKALAVGLILAVLAGCSGVRQRVGSSIPPGAQVTPGRVIEGQACSFLFFNSDRVPAAYRALVAAAGRDLITDVEISESSGCTRFRARAVRIVRAATPP